MSREIELLTEIRDLLQIMAEPALEKRDAKLRSSLRTTVGSSGKKAKAALLMDGTRSQSAIAKQSGMDKGNLSRLVKAFAAGQLISADERSPKLLLKVPSSFFDGHHADE
jgi:DNA-binding MarR family transcriptional regulator